MSAELGFNAYVLVGNVLNYLVNGIRIDSEAELNTPATDIADLYGKLQPLAPQDILPAIAALKPSERSLLDRCCRYCLRAMEEDEIHTLLGLPRETAEAVLTQLALEPAHYA